MAKIINVDTKKEIEIPDEGEIRDACEDLGVPFGCRNGICGTCMIDIVEGEENLSELTEKEHDLDRDRTHRLACQSKVKSGNIKIEF